MLGCLALTLPLEFAFRAKVYRRPGRTVRAMALPVLLFVMWDAIAIARGTWWFSHRYTTGWIVAAGVPVEEAAFFIVIPLCTLLTYESIRTVLRRARRG